MIEKRQDITRLNTATSIYLAKLAHIEDMIDVATIAGEQLLVDVLTYTDAEAK